MNNQYKTIISDYRLYTVYQQLNIRPENFGNKRYVIFYGFDIIGKALFEQFKENENYEVVCFLDPQPAEEEYLGCPVFKMNPQDVSAIIESEVQVIVTSASYGKNMPVNEHIIYFWEVVTRRFFEEKFTTTERSELNIEPLMDLLAGENSIIKNVCLVGSLCGLLLYLLLKPIAETFFVIEDSKIWRNELKVLRKSGAPCMVLHYDEHVKGEATLALDILARLSSEDFNISVFGQDTLPTTPLLFGDRFILLEDGKASYKEKEKIDSKCAVYTYDDLVSKIIYTGLLDIPERLRTKGTVVDIEVLWNKKTELEKKTIMEIFGFDYDRMQKIIDEGRDTIVFTQPFSVESHSTEENQVRMYQEIVAKYDSNKVIFKPHPRDTIDYAKFLTKCEILPANFPSELIKLCKLPVRCAVGADEGSGVFGIFNDNIKADFYPEIMQKYDVKTFLV